MKWIAGLILALAFATDANASEQTLTFGRFGQVTVYRNTPEPQHMVIFVSGDGGWNLGVVDMARELAGQDATVVGVDITALFKRVGATQERCAYPAADFEQLSQYVQRELGFKSYKRPVLVGYSSGATLVYALLGQAPAGTFRGAMSLGFCPDLETPSTMCKQNGLKYSPNPKAKGVLFDVMTHFRQPFVALQGDQDQVCAAAATQAFVGRVTNGQVIMLPRVGHGFSVPRNWMPQFKQAFESIVSKAAVPAASAAPIVPASVPTDAVSGLPLTEVPATLKPEHDAVAILLTGDGGWAGLDQDVAAGLAADGLPVVGIDSLSYFWKRRTPDESATALAAVMRHYMSVWNKKRAILVGYSFGADVLPFVVNRLPADLRDKVGAVALLGMSPNATFEFHVANWVGFSLAESFPTAPEIAKLADVSVLCIYGVEETDSLCPKLGKPVEVLQLSGGHHFDGNYKRLAEEILKASRR